MKISRSLNFLPTIVPHRACVASSSLDTLNYQLSSTRQPFDRVEVVRLFLFERKIDLRSNDTKLGLVLRDSYLHKRSGFRHADGNEPGTRARSKKTVLIGFLDTKIKKSRKYCETAARSLFLLANGYRTIVSIPRNSWNVQPMLVVSRQYRWLTSRPI